MKTLLVSLVFIALQLPAFADEVQRAQRADVEARWHPYNQSFDKEVQLEGVGWGMGAKGLGIRVVLPEGVAVYFDPQDHDLAAGFAKWQGRLIQVTGTLRKRTMTPAPEGSQGYTSSFDYLVIEGATIKQIDRVSRGITNKAEQAGHGDGE